MGTMNDTATATAEATYVGTAFPTVAHIADPERIGATLCSHAYRWLLTPAQVKVLGVCVTCAEAANRVDACGTCNVPGPCNPRHVDCVLTDEERAAMEDERGDAAYHAARDRELER